jgi:hypothetical protein
VCHTLYSLAIRFAPSLADSIIFLMLTRLVVVINIVNFSFALFTPPLGDFQQRNEQPTPEGSLRTFSSGGQPQPPPGFAPPEGADATEDGEVIGVSAEEQLQLWTLRIKNRNLQKQKEILEAKHQRVSA